MTTPVIIDIVAAGILLGFGICSAHRGLIRSLAGLLVVVVSLVGAGVLAGALSGPLSQAVTPLIQGQIEARMEQAWEQQASEPQMPEADLGSDTEIAGLLALIGLDGELVDSLTEQARERVENAGISIAMAVVESVAHSMLYALLLLISFVLLMVLLKLLVRALDLVFRLPGLHLLNTLGGAAAGLVEGALVLFLAVWLLRRFGVSFDTETVSATYILQFFTTHTPLDMLSFLE